MKMVKPVTVTDAILTSSTLSEADYAAWNSGTSYVAGNKVMVVATHKIYESLTSNTNKYPPSYLAGTSPDWMDRGSTNKWKMFDQSYNSQSVSATSPLTVVLTPGQIINTLALLNLSGATSVNIVGMVGAEEKYNKTVSLFIGDLGDWYEYFFSPIELKSDVVLTDIPAYPTIELTITIYGTAPSLGILQMGFYTQIGETLWGIKGGITNYSKKELNEFGDFTIVVRKFSKNLSADIYIDNSRTGYIERLMATYKDTPILWIGNENFEISIVYGFIKDFSIVLPDYSGAFCSLELEGLT